MDLVDLATHLRDRGMTLAERAEEFHTPGWGDRALAALTRIAKRQQYLFTDDLRRELKEEPAHHNAFGAVWMKALKARIIERTNETRHSSIPSLHKHRYTLYRSNLYRRDMQ